MWIFLFSLFFAYASEYETFQLRTMDRSPLSLLEGTLQDRESFLDKNHQEEFNGFKLVGLIQYINPGPKKQVKQNPPDDVVDDQTQFYMDSRRIFSDGKIQMRFRVCGDKLCLDQTLVHGQLSDIEVKHYSITPDRSLFSILTYSEEVGGDQTLRAFVFRRPNFPALSEDVTPSDYNFILGKKKRAQLRKGFVIHICEDEDRIANQWTTYMGEWTRYISQQGIRIRRLKVYPPFSDVNQNCLYYFKRLGFPKPATAWVNPVTDISAREIVSTFMVTGYLGRGLILHEFGHILGLHHQFDPNIKSIMSYSWSKGLTDYDRGAIRKLYK